MVSDACLNLLVLVQYLNKKLKLSLRIGVHFFFFFFTMFLESPGKGLTSSPLQWSLLGAEV